ncbi:MAG TPA: pyridoxamine 5'-phosphate oxidase family protein [Chloroflexota bacterium]
MASTDTPPASYHARVPAVARAVQALEHLSAAQQPLSLSALSRAIDVGPSSLLAILTTLRSVGLVSRSARDGRYQPGPGLVALGTAAAQRLEPLQTFDLLAADLVDQLGETVLLWIQQGDGLAMAAARDGTQPLRYVPPLGLRLPATGWAIRPLSDAAADQDDSDVAAAADTPAATDPHAAAAAGTSAATDSDAVDAVDAATSHAAASAGTLAAAESDAAAAGQATDLAADAGLAEGELEPGVWMLAASLDDRALLAVVGPTARLRGAPGEPARRALRAIAGGDGVWTGSGPIEGAELDAFLSQALVASLSYLSSDGYPASVPLWYDWDGEAFWLVPSPGAEWAEHVRRNPRVSLSISESTPPLRRVLARGPMHAVDADDAGVSQWRGVEGRLAARYARLDAARLLEGRSGQPRTVLRLVPERLIAWRGLLRPAASGPARLQPRGSARSAPSSLSSVSAGGAGASASSGVGGAARSSGVTRGSDAAAASDAQASIAEQPGAPGGGSTGVGGTDRSTVRRLRSVGRG